MHEKTEGNTEGKEGGRIINDGDLVFVPPIVVDHLLSLYIIHDHAKVFQVE